MSYTDYVHENKSYTQ